MNIDKISKTTDSLIKHKIIPEVGLFDITEDMLCAYISIYNRVNGLYGRRYDKHHARRLAGLNLLNLKLQNRGGSPSNCKEGMVYLIENPSFPDHYKVGITTSIPKRLATYQTCSPYRDYSVKKYEFSRDRKQTENAIFCLNEHFTCQRRVDT